jgi:hypothetical protein
LKVLYEQLSPYSVKSVIGEMAVRSLWGGMFTKRVPNPSYPKEDYEAFVARVIARKKQRIEIELDTDGLPGPNQA